MFCQLDEVLMWVSNSEIEARCFQHETFKSNDYLRWSFESLQNFYELDGLPIRLAETHTIVRAEVFRGRNPKVMGRAEDLS